MITTATLRRWCADDLLARVAWSRLTEPSDLVAEALRRELGHGPALLVALGVDPLPAAVAGVTDGRRDLAAAYRRWEVRAAVCDPERDVEAIASAGGRVVVPGDPEWPSRLADLDAAVPVCLWLRGAGSLTSLVQQSVAVVGARASTRYGDTVAEDMAVGLSGQGVTVVSGAAIGIDAAAHRGALAVKRPTVAVLACGADRTYPASHDLLLGRIAETGLIVSELPPGSTPTRWRFLERNRLIAALTRATVVVEAGWRSGAINTARTAQSLGRTVLAVPGPITSQASAGCHRLIREGAADLVTSADEVLEQIRPVGEAMAREPLVRARPHDSLTTAELRVWEVLPPRGWRSVAQVAIGAGLDQALTRRILDRLSVEGFVRTRGGVNWQRVVPV